MRKFSCDPECSTYSKGIAQIEDDPMTAYSGVGDEVIEGFTRKHRATCLRCQEYGVANVEVE